MFIDLTYKREREKDMEKNMVVACLFLLLLVESCGMKVVDLTWAHSTSTIYWPGNSAFNFTIVFRENLTKYWYESNWFATPEHGGTHLDAPSHFFKGGWRAQEIPAERLIGPAVILDVTSQAEADPDYRVTQSDFEAYESEHGRIPHGAIVIMNSGWGSRYPNETRVFNTDQPRIPSTFHFPGFHEDAIAWMVANRNVSMVGVDTPSLDHGQSADFKVHVILGSKNIPGLENVARLERIPKKGATIFVGSIKLFDGSGGPVRILATFDQDDKRCDCVSIGSKIERYESNWFATPEHGGTHLDAPSHFFKGGWRAQEIPAERLIGPAVILDVTSQAEADPDYRVTQSDFEAYESEHGRIPHGAIVIMNSGWGSRYPNETRVFNTDQPRIPSTFHFPGFHEDAIAWMVANRNVSMVGVDTPSLDHGQSADFKVHVILGSKNIPGLENVARLERIPKKGATIFVGSIKLFDGSGGPVRILATFDQDDKRCDCVSIGSKIERFVGGIILSILLALCFV